MSLVQAVITDNFLLFGADKKGIMDGTKEYYENCNKLIKLNKEIIFGCTGGILDNFKLFEGFCSYSEQVGLIPSDNSFDLSYNEFVKIISVRFENMYKEHIDSKNTIRYDIKSLIGGFNGEEFEVTLFNLDDKCSFEDNIVKAYKPTNFPYKGVTAGETIHSDNLHIGVYKTYREYGENITILQYKNIMKDVFEKGMEIDETINNNICFERIKRKDVIN